VPVSPPDIMAKALADAIKAAFLSATPTVPQYDVEASTSGVKLKPKAPIPPTVDEKLIQAIAKGVADVMYAQFSAAIVFFPPPPGLKAIVGGMPCEVQGTGKLK